MIELRINGDDGRTSRTATLNTLVTYDPIHTERTGRSSDRSVEWGIIARANVILTVGVGVTGRILMLEM